MKLLRWTNMFVAGLLAMGLAQGAFAQGAPPVVIKVESKTFDLNTAILPADSFFDVFVELAPGVSAGSVSLSGFQAAVNLDPSAAGSIQLLPASASSAVLPASPHAPLITQGFTPDFGGDNGHGRASATAATSSAGSSVAITPGAGLFRVPFQVLAGAAPGHYNLVIDIDEFAGTLLTNAAGDIVPYSVVNGAIDLIAPVQAVSSIALLPTPPVGPNAVVHVTGGNHKYLSDKADLAPARGQGTVGINHVGTEGKTLVMLWLDGAAADIAALVDHLKNKPGYQIALANAGAADPLFGDLQALKQHYQGFNALVAFDQGIANNGFTWDLAGDPNVKVAGVAAVPEPASALGLMGLALVAGVARRRRMA